MGHLLSVHCPLVDPQMGVLNEALLAQLADEGPLAGVRPLMRDEVSANIAGIVAL